MLSVSKYMCDDCGESLMYCACENNPLNEDKGKIMKYGILNIEYEDGQVIHSAVMGDGTVGVSDILLNDDGFVGVALWPAPDNKTIGIPIAQENNGKLVTDLNIKFQMLFDNPDSIDVVILKLQDAKRSLAINIKTFDDKI